MAEDAARALALTRVSGVLDELLVMIQSSDPVTRSSGVLGLGAAGEAARPAVPKLMALYDRERDLHVKCSVVASLGQIGPFETVSPKLINILSDGTDAELRANAAVALAYFPEHSSRIRPLLEKLARDPQEQLDVCRGAVIGLNLLKMRSEAH
jgi:hypothetical protein